MPSPAEQIFRGAFTWIADRTGELRMRDRSGRARMVATKQLAELAMLARAVRDADRRARELLLFAWDETGRGRSIAESLAIDPAIAIAYLTFFQAGLRSRELEEELARAHATWDHTTWPALRRYATGFMLETLGIEPAWSTRDASAATVGAERVASFPLHVAIVAHVVMWETQMGARPDLLAPEARAEIAISAPACASHLVAANEFDPLCELVIASSCVGGPTLPDALVAIASVQRADGSVPPMRGAPDTFVHLYHSTLVAALASGLNTIKETA